MKKKQSYRPHRTSAPKSHEPPEAGDGPDGPILDIDLGAIVANWRALRDRSAARETAAVLKADAYGCGAGDVAPALEAAGCRSFFVATPGEAAKLAGVLGPECEIFVLDGFPGAGRWPADPRIRPVLSTLDEARAWAASATAGAEAALQIETGMNRLGLTEGEQREICAGGVLAKDSVTLVMSHLASAAGPDDPLLRAQKTAYQAALPAFRSAFPQARLSLSATAGAVLGSEIAFDMIRPGIGLYGGLPFQEARPVVRLSAPLIRVWEVEPGARSGYGGDWVAARPSRLAALPLGYADGLPRSLAGRWRARIETADGLIAAPMAGRVSMDLIVLDVTDLDPAPRRGDRAWLLDEALTIDAMAEAAGTIGYEILTGLDAARRLERRLNPV